MTDQEPDETQVPPVPARLPTGVLGLDTVLLGGFVKNGLYIIQGSPGAGKTILSNQICYSHAADGGRTLYVTLLSEQHDRLLANLGQMAFFDASRVAREILYVSAFQLLERDKLAGLLTMLRREIVSHRASLLILDGLVAAEAYASSALELKKFIHELQMLAAVADCTMILLTSTGAGPNPGDPRSEHTMVDGLVALRDVASSWRVERNVEVVKLRGSDHLRGRHAMRITPRGVEVWPRLESLPLSDELYSPEAAAARLSTGVPGLDVMLDGGVPAQSSTLVLGPSGSGKTSIGLQFLAACTPQHKGVFLGFYETPAQLEVHAAGMSQDFAGMVASGAVSIMWQGPAEDLIDRVACDLLVKIRETGARRVVIDGLLGFENMTVQPERMPSFFRGLMLQLRDLDITTLCTIEVADLVGRITKSPIQQLTPVAENLILLTHVGSDNRLVRQLSVLKLRGCRFDTRTRQFRIGAGGISLVTDLEDNVAGAAPPEGAASWPLSDGHQASGADGEPES